MSNKSKLSGWTAARCAGLAMTKVASAKAVASTQVAVTTLAMALSAQAFAGPADPLKVAVIVSLDPQAINVPTVELFRAVQDGAQVSPGFIPGAATQEVREKLAAPGALATLGTIPAFDRKDFLKANGNKPSKKSKRRVIRPVQKMLDTLALDGAVIVDCAPAGTAAVKNCGLYYYDRSLGRVLAATSKEFRVGVADASRWAPSLLSNLSQGLTAYESQLERDRLKQVIAESNVAEDSSKFTAELKLQGQSLAEPSRQVTALPGAALRLGRQDKGYSTGLELGYAKATAEGEDAKASLTEKLAGLFFSVESRALESMIWDLGLGVNYAILTAERESLAELDEENGHLEARLIKLRFAPGVLWEVSKGLQFGAAFNFDRLVPFAESKEGAYQNDKFAKNSLGFGLLLRTVL
jgi:hypothetical protein